MTRRKSSEEKTTAPVPQRRRTARGSRAAGASPQVVHEERDKQVQAAVVATLEPAEQATIAQGVGAVNRHKVRVAQATVELELMERGLNMIWVALKDKYDLPDEIYYLPETGEVTAQPQAID